TLDEHSSKLYNFVVNQTSRPAEPKFTIVPKDENQSIGTNDNLELNLQHINYFGQRHEGEYTVRLYHQEGKENKGDNIFIESPPDPKRGYLSDRVEIKFSNTESGHHDHENMVYIEGGKAYNSNMPNDLVFSITNKDKNNPLKNNENSKFGLSFVTINPDDSKKVYGALTTSDNLKNIKVSHKSGYGTWDIKQFDNSKTAYITSKVGNILGIEENSSAEFLIQGIKSNMPVGMTPMYLNYDSIEEYNNGNLEVSIEKALPMPTIVSFNISAAPNLFDNNNCQNLKLEGDFVNEIRFDYYVYGAREWMILMFTSDGKPISKSFTIDTPEKQNSYISFNATELPYASEYNVQLSPIENINSIENLSTSKVYKYEINKILICDKIISPDMIRSINTESDLNGDGINDMIINAYGTIKLLYGNKNNNFPKDLNKISPEQGFVIDGYVVGSHDDMNIADINNDGLDDIIIGLYKKPDYKIFAIYGNTVRDFPRNLNTIKPNQGRDLAPASYKNVYSLHKLKIDAGDMNHDSIDDVITYKYTQLDTIEPHKHIDFTVIYGGNSEDYKSHNIHSTNLYVVPPENILIGNFSFEVSNIMLLSKNYSNNFIVYGVHVIRIRPPIKPYMSKLTDDLDNMDHNQGCRIESKYIYEGDIYEGDVNSDKISDVISINGKDLGVIYGNQKNRFCSGELNHDMKFSLSKGNFDKISVGDINGDGINEIVISAFIEFEANREIYLLYNKIFKHHQNDEYSSSAELVHTENLIDILAETSASHDEL
ncbi:MAG: VCBS repeat-containing protein, partial [Rickettsiales bacterium]